MSIINKNAVAYLAPTAGRRYLTIKGAAAAEARALIRQKHPTIEFDQETGESFYWRDIPRSDVMYRRLTRKIFNDFRVAQ